jgi:hypothetical protein
VASLAERNSLSAGASHPPALPDSSCTSPLFEKVVKVMATFSFTHLLWSKPFTKHLTQTTVLGKVSDAIVIPILWMKNERIRI